MNRQEALKHFLKTYAEDVLNQKLHQVASLYGQRVFRNDILKSSMF